MLCTIPANTWNASTSQPNVENKLDKIIAGFRAARKDSSVIPVETVDSLQSNDQEVWRITHKELEEMGILLATFEANRDIIFRWFIAAVESGSFEEQQGATNAN